MRCSDMTYPGEGGVNSSTTYAPLGSILEDTRPPLILVIALFFRLSLLFGYIRLIYQSFHLCQYRLPLHRLEVLCLSSEDDEIGSATSI